ncbi:MAG: proton-conducting transporter membrane subunit [Pseudomonadota bacterium]
MDHRARAQEQQRFEEGVGSVIHAMSDEQDMRKMGGIWRKVPITYTTMWIGSLALGGIPIFAGYYSKDMIIETAFAAHSDIGTYAYWMGTLAAGLTALYSWRLLFMTFHGECRADAQTQAHIHESPYTMTGPLVVLAIGATTAGFLGTAMINPDLAFWTGSLAMPEGHNILEEAHHTPFFYKFLPLLFGVVGIGIAYVCYIARPGLPEVITAKVRPLHAFLYNKWYFDELYDFIFVRGAKGLGTLLWRGGDQGIIDRFGPDGVAGSALATAKQAVRLQTGFVYHYAFAMLIGMAALVSIFLYWSRG